MKIKTVLSPNGHVHGGAKVPHRKNTSEFKTEIMPTPSTVTIPMQMHIGAPCEPTVKVGDKVKIGDIIGDSQAFVSAPVHASVSGTVKSIIDFPAQNGGYIKAVVIESDGQNEVSDSIIEKTVTSAADLVSAARESGLVGLGGAGFPTHIKLSPKSDVRLDTLIINAAECEPYITTDYRECMENSEDILGGIYLVKKHLSIKNVYIAIEDNKPLAIKLLAEKISAMRSEEGEPIRIVKLKSRYPQGAEKVLIQAVTKRKVPSGCLPADVGCIVMNVTSVALLHRFIKTGMPLVNKRITVDGSAINQPKNLLVPIGTSVSDIIEFCNGCKSIPGKIIMGGPMMGMAQPNLLPVIQKQNNAVLILNKADATKKEESACIRCGRCVSACPMNLMPTLIERLASINDVESLDRIGVTVCMECGCCAFNCPASRPLVQYMRNAKAVYRKGIKK
ncbi:MAG: electron transport complex subunit RsxC [Clostridia bacterium]|nr:electron transport complex subunit RsxC [Clostridia bacterium]